MKTYAVLGLGLLSLFAAACGSADASTDDGADLSSDALSGSIQAARGCAIRDAYTKATVADLAPVAFADLSPALKQGLASRGATTSYGAPYGDLVATASLSQLQVPGVGSVLVLEQSVLINDAQQPWTNIDFYDTRGQIALYAMVASGAPLSFSLGVPSLTVDPDSGTATRGSAVTPLVCK